MLTKRYQKPKEVSKKTNYDSTELLVEVIDFFIQEGQGNAIKRVVQIINIAIIAIPATKIDPKPKI